MTLRHLDVRVRHDMVFLFDVVDGNPNGDPDADNRPRTDLETGHGLVTDVALKRKIRDTLRLAGGNDPRYGLFVEAGHALNPRLEESYMVSGLTLGDKRISPADARAARDWLCDRYVDLRLFGGVLSVGGTRALGQIRGPLQVTIARSIDPVAPVAHLITRVTQTRQRDIDKGETTEIGSKWTIPYGLYRCEIYYSANRAARTGIDANDLALLYRSIHLMFDHDRAAAKGKLSPRGLYVFSHADAFGSAPAHALTERVRVRRVDPAARTPPRGFTDYRVEVDAAALPAGVTLTEPFA